MRILVVEDELPLREGLRDLLVGDGHQVSTASDGALGLELGLAQSFDLVLLDRMMPKLDGVEVCRRLRAARPGMPILMLTARGAEQDKVEGLTEGADDYLTKPFGARELIARIRALGRRAPAPEPEVVDCGELVLDLGRLTARRGEDEVALTAREVGIVRLLRRRRGEPVTRAELLEQVWGLRGDLKTRAIDMAVAVLRKKLEVDAGRPLFILSVKGRGYSWGGP